MKASSKTIRDMATAFLFGRMEEYIMANGKMGSNTEEESRQILMALIESENGLMDRE